jgi:hypothetical protein
MKITLAMVNLIKITSKFHFSVLAKVGSTCFSRINFKFHHKSVGHGWSNKINLKNHQKCVGQRWFKVVRLN